MNKSFDNFDHFSGYTTTFYEKPEMWNNIQL